MEENGELNDPSRESDEPKSGGATPFIPRRSPSFTAPPPDPFIAELRQTLSAFQDAQNALDRPAIEAAQSFEEALSVTYHPMIARAYAAREAFDFDIREILHHSFELNGVSQDMPGMEALADSLTGKTYAELFDETIEYEGVTISLGDGLREMIAKRDITSLAQTHHLSEALAPVIPAEDRSRLDEYGRWIRTDRVDDIVSHIDQLMEELESAPKAPLPETLPSLLDVARDALAQSPPDLQMIHDVNQRIKLGWGDIGDLRKNGHLSDEQATLLFNVIHRDLPSVGAAFDVPEHMRGQTEQELLDPTGPTPRYFHRLPLKDGEAIENGPILDYLHQLPAIDEDLTASEPGIEMDVSYDDIDSGLPSELNRPGTRGRGRDI